MYAARPFITAQLASISNGLWWMEDRITSASTRVTILQEEKTIAINKERSERRFGLLWEEEEGVPQLRENDLAAQESDGRPVHPYAALHHQRDQIGNNRSR